MRQWRIAAIVYCIQMGLALTLGMQVYRVLESSIGHSLEVNQLLIHYDHTVLTDFLKVHGASITPLIGQLRWLLLVWLFFSVFTDAGLLACIALPEQASGRFFWASGAGYFFSFVKIGLLFLMLAVVWTAIIWAPVALSLESWLQNFPSEKYAVGLVLTLLFLYLLGLAVLFIWSVVSRWIKIKTGVSLPASLQTGWQSFWRNKRNLLMVLFGFVALQIFLVGAYWLLESVSGMTSPLLVLIFFVVQQAFVFFRIQIRQMMYASFSALTAT